MKKLKKINKIAVSVLIGILLCLGNGQSVLAENTLQIGIDQYEVLEDGHILVYVNHNGEDKFEPTIAGSSLLIGKNTLEIDEIQSFSGLNEPTTYLCLIDISGSMTDSGIEQIKEVLTEFAETKGEQDNICITTMGNDVTSSGFLTDQEKLSEAIGGIERVSTEDTNLYYGITEALNVLKTDNQVHKKRCLLIFSDGEDDQKKGITEKEAEDAVKDTHIPVFTIAMEGSNLKDAEESAKILGSFARISAGGESYTPLLDDEYDYADICERINTRLRTSLIVSANLENIKEIGDDTVYIGLELSDGTEKASDGITVPAGSILEAIETIRDAAGKTEITYTIIHENPAPEVVEPIEQGASINIYVVTGIALLFLVLIIVLILWLRRRKSKQNDTDDAAKDVNDGNYDTSDTTGQESLEDSNHFDPGMQKGTNLPEASENNINVKRNKKIQVTLYKVGPGEEESYRLNVKDEVVIGRNKDCQLSLEHDSALSGRHCSIIYRDGYIYVRDEKSTNGTYVNGVPIVGEFKVEKDDILLIGSSEYRVVWD